MDNTITIALDGDIPLPGFAEAIRRFSNLVDILTREVAEGAEIDWFVEELQAGSAIATITGESNHVEAVQKVVVAYSEVGQALQKRQPIPYSPHVAREAVAITKVISDKIISVRFQTAQTDSIIYGDFETRRIISSEPITSFGVVEGRVQTISMRRNLQFTLYDPIFDKPVKCFLGEEQETLMTEIWGKRVTVTGRVTREPDNGRPISVRGITSIEPIIEVEPGSYRIARGALAWVETDESSETIMRRVHDA